MWKTRKKTTDMNIARDKVSNEYKHRLRRHSPNERSCSFQKTVFNEMLEKLFIPIHWAQVILKICSFPIIVSCRMHTEFNIAAEWLHRNRLSPLQSFRIFYASETWQTSKGTVKICSWQKWLGSMWGFAVGAMCNSFVKCVSLKMIQSTE